MSIDFIYLYLLIGLYFSCFWKIFEKAGHEKWKSFVPGLNFYIWLKIMKKPWWWILILLIPGANYMLLVVMHVELARSYGRRAWHDTLVAVTLPHYTILSLALDTKIRYTGPVDYKGVHRSRGAEWLDAFVFALIAAFIIRVYTFELYKIPTGSMEKSMMIGDYLLVSKINYGPRVPNTPLSIPFFHNNIPGVNWNSYFDWLPTKYTRLPGFQNIKRNDVVVFNFPANDTAINDPYYGGHTYSQIVRNNGFEIWLRNNPNKNPFDFEKEKARYFEMVRKDIDNQFGLKTRPVDKRENYIKRCVAIAGDSISIVNGKIYINGKENELSPTGQYVYSMKLNNVFDDFEIKKNLDINRDPSRYSQGLAHVKMAMSESVAEKIARYPNVDSIWIDWKEKGYYNNFKSEYGMMPQYLPIFPNHMEIDWTEDNFGPLYLPKKGDKIELTKENALIYRRAIEAYEGNKFEEKTDGVYLNSKLATEYTFKMDYYWLMGDNRHESADSRFWGYVPVNHVVGKAIFIFYSSDPETGSRWNRAFSLIK
ncbi:MAG: signal peptidase I [Flavobacteriales bacterium]